MVASSENVKAETNGVLDFPKHLRAYLQRMRDDELSHDVVFVVNGQRIPAHRCLVAAASPVLRSMLTNGMKETRQRDIVLREVHADAFRVVLDYMYAGQMNISSVDEALRYLDCADWLQMEELVDAISEFIERKLDRWNCSKVLVAADRPSLIGLQEIGMKTLVENFHDVWCYSGFMDLPFDVVLDILRCDELVVRSELDVFLAVIRWIVWSGYSEMTVIAKKTCELIEEHTGLRLLDVDVAEAEDTYGEVNYTELFDCVDISKLSNADLQMVGMLCLMLCKEAHTCHRLNLLYVQEFGEKAVEKLLQSDLSIPSIPVTLPKRVPHHRNDMVFAFSYRVYTAQLELGGSLSAVTSPWFVDKRCNVKWAVKVQPGGKTPTKPGHLGIFLRRSIDGSAKEEESEFGDLIYVEVGKNKIFSRTTKKNSTRSYQNACGMGYRDFLPLSTVEGEESVNVGVVIYFQGK